MSPMREAHCDRIRAFSPRSLPTNHNHNGGRCARLMNIRVINHRHELPRLLFTRAWPRHKKRSLDHSGT